MASMIRVNLTKIARFSAQACLIATLAAFGLIGATSTAFARLPADMLASEAVVLKEKPRDTLTQVAQRKRLKKRRKQRRRGLNNRQSNSAVSSGKATSLGNVARSVRRRVPGQLLDARLVKDRSGRLTYRLKILGRNGVMRNVTADAYTGAILGVR